MQFYLPDDLVSKLRLVSWQEGRPMSEIVREGVEREVKTKKKNKMTSGEALLKMAEHAFEGPGDLSTNLFDYLYGDKSPNYGKGTRKRKG